MGNRKRQAVVPSKGASVLEELKSYLAHARDIAARYRLFVGISLGLILLPMLFFPRNEATYFSGGSGPSPREKDSLGVLSGSGQAFSNVPVATPHAHRTSATATLRRTARQPFRPDAGERADVAAAPRPDPTLGEAVGADGEATRAPRPQSSSGGTLEGLEEAEADPFVQATWTAVLGRSRRPWAELSSAERGEAELLLQVHLRPRPPAGLRLGRRRGGNSWPPLSDPPPLPLAARLPTAPIGAPGPRRVGPRALAVRPWPPRATGQRRRARRGGGRSVAHACRGPGPRGGTARPQRWGSPASGRSAPPFFLNCINRTSFYIEVAISCK